MRQKMKLELLMNGVAIDNYFSQDQQTIGQMKNSKTNLYIKGLPSNFGDEDILNLAPTKSAIRSVKAAVEDDRKCKGYGFIDFLTPEDAKSGMAYIQEKNPNYTIKFAKENEKDKTNLYVTNLPKSWTSKDSDKLKGLFDKYGGIQSAFIMLEKYGNKPLGVGFVRFFNEESAYKAITDLETNPQLASVECVGPLEAKYADKHATDTRRKYSNGKSSFNGKLQPSSHMPLLTNTNSNQLLSALLDENYRKSPHLYTIPSLNASDAYSQYLLNIAQLGLIDPFCFLPTGSTATNYFNSYNNNVPQAASFCPNIVYSLPPNVPVDPMNSYLIPNNGLTSIMTNVPFVHNFNQNLTNDSL